MRLLIPTLVISSFAAFLSTVVANDEARQVELTLNLPADFQVIQRTGEGSGIVQIHGRLVGGNGDSDVVEARLLDAANKEILPWRPLQLKMNTAEWTSQLVAPAGGWYELQVRVRKNDHVLANANVEHVGVGEIFVVAGQSNSANHGEEKLKTATKRVAAFDGAKWRLADDPQPGASGNRGSFLPAFGDALVVEFDVPVGLVACGIGATSVREWLPRGSRFPNPPTIERRVQKVAEGEWESKGEAFEMLVERMRSLEPRGFRAVLWHQGESDANQKDGSRTLAGSLYRTYLEKLIRDSQREIGWKAPWFVAQVSYHGPGDEASSDIRAAQASLWRDGVALEGPDSDALKGDLRERNGQGVHFSEKGLRVHAARWADKVIPWITTRLKTGAPVTKQIKRPNILWIVVDDMSANFSCYGEQTITTPAVDQLAADGLKFTRAYATAPVCSPFRSAMITGMYQTTIGSHHHRSGRGKHLIQLPNGVHPVPELFKEAGYWTCIGSGLPGFDFRSLPTKRDRRGKTDYNFDWDETIYDSHDWADREAGQPFFMQVQLHGGKLRGASVAANEALAKRAARELGSTTDPEDVSLPPYYPRDPLLLKDWATYLDSVRLTDRHVGEVIKRLKDESVLDNTLVVFFTDHGISHARGKQFLYDEGTHIPLIIRGPGISPGETRNDLVEHIDIAALSLSAAGIPIPETMQGRNVLAEDYQPRGAAFAARDRCGETVDRIRSVRDDRYLYIRNYHWTRPHLQPSQYKDAKAIVQKLRELHANDSLDELSQRLLFAPQRPPEELYDYTTDRWQVNNLLLDPKHDVTLKNLRAKLDDWIRSTGDLGTESPEVYALEVADELNTMKTTSARYKTFRENAKLMKQWAADGR